MWVFLVSPPHLPLREVSDSSVEKGKERPRVARAGREANLGEELPMGRRKEKQPYPGWRWMRGLHSGVCAWTPRQSTEVKEESIRTSVKCVNVIPPSVIFDDHVSRVVLLRSPEGKGVPPLKRVSRDSSPSLWSPPWALLAGWFLGA